LGLAIGWGLSAAVAAAGVLYLDDIGAFARRLLPPPAPAATSAQAYALEKGVRPATGARFVELKADAYGHYYTAVEINGRRIEVLVDSGASIVALTFDDARRAGLFVRPSDFTHRVSTANGPASVAPVVLDRVSIGDITVRNVPAAVSEPGKLNTSLLGMSFLNRLQRLDMRGGILILQE
jgi:aspartyl protease family protein